MRDDRVSPPTGCPQPGSPPALTQESKLHGGSGAKQTTGVSSEAQVAENRHARTWTLVPPLSPRLFASLLDQSELHGSSVGKQPTGAWSECSSAETSTYLTSSTTLHHGAACNLAPSVGASWRLCCGDKVQAPGWSAWHKRRARTLSPPLPRTVRTLSPPLPRTVEQRQACSISGSYMAALCEANCRCLAGRSAQRQIRACT